MASLAIALPASAAATTPQPANTATNPPSASVASVEQAIAARPSSAKLPSADRAALAKSFYDFAQFVKAHPELMQQAQAGRVNPAGMVHPDFSVGFGWHIYFHHLTPNDQRYFMDIGVGGVAFVICAASEFDPAVCGYGGIIAFVLITTINHYYHPPYCLEIQINYGGSLHKAYRTRC